MPLLLLEGEPQQAAICPPGPTPPARRGTQRRQRHSWPCAGPRRQTRRGSTCVAACRSRLPGTPWRPQCARRGHKEARGLTDGAQRGDIVDLQEGELHLAGLLQHHGDELGAVGGRKARHKGRLLGLVLHHHRRLRGAPSSSRRVRSCHPGGTCSTKPSPTISCHCLRSTTWLAGRRGLPPPEGDSGGGSLLLWRGPRALLRLPALV